MTADYWFKPTSLRGFTFSPALRLYKTSAPARRGLTQVLASFRGVSKVMKACTGLIAVILICAGCSTVSSSPPAFLSKVNTCAVLSGGGGMVFPDSAMNDEWFKINSAVSNDLGNTLEADGYRIARLIVDMRDKQARLKATSVEMQRSQCNEIIQVSHSLGGMSPPGVAKYFELTVDVLGTVHGTSTLQSEYHKTYRYPLTKEVMQNLSMRAVAASMAADLEGAHVINKAPSR